MNNDHIHPGSERPEAENIPEFYRDYILEAEGEHLFDALEIALDRTLKLAKTFPENVGKLRYAEGKWSINEILQHIIDGERIFCNRALRFARGDETELPGFEENDYVPASNADARRTDLLLKELVAVRMATIALFVSFDEAMLRRSGPANGQRMKVQEIGWAIAGHHTHHLTIIKERYLSSA